MNRYNLWILIGAGMLATVSCATKEADDINQPEPVDPTFAQQTEKHLIK